MAKIITFTPQRNLSAMQNLEAFIAMAKNDIPTWGDQKGFHWAAISWPTTFATARFTNHENRRLHRTKKPSEEQLLHPAFLDVARAYLRHRHHTEPHKGIAREMQALRALEYALRQDMGVPDITKVSQRHFDQAVEAVTGCICVSTVATEVLYILKRLADFSIVTPRARFWQHPYIGALSYDRTRGIKAPQQVKDEKIPHQDALLAIGEVFSRGYKETLEDVDVLITSVTALLLSAPTRIMETARFRTDCLASDNDRDGKKQYYLKYWVPKILAFARKPIPETMAETAVEAIKRLTDITKDGRRLARYLETGPTKFYRHENCPNVHDDQLLTLEQAALALGLTTNSVSKYLQLRTGSGAVNGHTLNSLWQIVLEDNWQANPSFPYQCPIGNGSTRNLKMSESLLCCRRHQFSTEFGTSPVLLAPFNRAYYASRLSAKIKPNGEYPNYCFYTRHGFVPIKLKSHSPRHLLNRMAKQNGVSIDVITAWSSRSSVRQTFNYLDNDHGEAADAAAAILEAHVEHGTEPPLTSEEAQAYGQGPIHRSRYGLCRRSWRVGPCNKFADCLNCSELIMCKGDNFAAKVIAFEREQLASTYNAAQDALARGERSATRWMKVSGPQLKKLDNLLMILNDPAIPDGSPIELTGTDFNHEDTVLANKAEETGVKLLARQTLAIEYGAELLACFDELRNRNAKSDQ